MPLSLEALRQSPFHRELGRKMCAAFIAQQQGIALETALRKVSDPIGDLWFLVAEFARHSWAASADSGDPSAIDQRDSGFVV